MKKRTRIFWISFLSAILFLTVLWAIPQYRVYNQRKHGEAALARANADKEVIVTEAKAQMEAADYLAMKDTIRAHGIARANQIIGQSLKENKEYLQWLWIEQIEKANTIYIPTEGNFPILEAGRLQMERDKGPRIITDSTQH